MSARETSPASWPRTPDQLVLEQQAVAHATWTPWRASGRYTVGACFVCFDRFGPQTGVAGEAAWAAATAGNDVAVACGQTDAPYEAGLLALREGALLEEAVGRLPSFPEVLLVDATGRDHPRRCGLALHLGAVLGLPTVGVTHRPLLARGEWPAEERGATAPLLLDGELVGYWLRTRAGMRPLAVHSAWRTGPDAAVEVVLSASGGVRTPEPMRRARTAARRARAEGMRPEPLPAWS